jgi:xylan 1,4-beta-xylosidase
MKKCFLLLFFVVSAVLLNGCGESGDKRINLESGVKSDTHGKTTENRRPLFMKFQNPVIRGFNPDPSICRVGKTYYLVTSSFEYFPGVPVYRSSDLAHWELIGYCLDRDSQLNVAEAISSRGIFAPTIRYHNGTFYMVTTNVDGGGNFYVTAKNPAGPWSEPIWLDRGGTDPSLFFDDDGKVYYTRHEGMGDGYIAQATLNLKTGRLEGCLKEIWRGTGGVWPEGPHLYKVNGRYFLMIAEGGTSYDHMVTIARSNSPWGPFIPDPNNPILTHRDRPESPIQALGHADMVETPGGWWMVFLGIREVTGRFPRVHILGRETFLAPVEWTKDGWPIVNKTGTVDIETDAQLPRWQPIAAQPTRDDFNNDKLALCWNYRRNPNRENFSLTQRPGWLRISCSPVKLSDIKSPAFIGRRQDAFNCTAETLVDFTPQNENEEAGLLVLMNDTHHHEIIITKRAANKVVLLRRQIGTLWKEENPVKITDEQIKLFIFADEQEYKFAYAAKNAEPTIIGNGEVKPLSTEAAGGFTGMFFGIYATANGKQSTNKAYFDYFDYKTD